MEAAETDARQSHDVHIASYAAGLRARIAIHRHEFEEALMHTAERWSVRRLIRRARSSLPIVVLRPRARDVSESEARCAEVHELASSGIEAAAPTACALAILALTEDPSNSGVAADAFRQVEATGALDSFITAAREALVSSQRFLRVSTTGRLSSARSVSRTTLAGARFGTNSRWAAARSYPRLDTAGTRSGPPSRPRLHKPNDRARTLYQ